MPEENNNNEETTVAATEETTPPAPVTTSAPAPVTTEEVAASAVKNTEEETVTVPKATMDALLTRLEKVEEETRLRALVDDKNTANKIDEMRKAGKLVKSMKVRKIEGKLVLAWKLIKDEVYFREGRLHEEQTMKIFYRDKSEQEMSLRQWATASEYVACEVLKVSTDRDGNEMAEVMTPDGDEFEVGIKYVN